MGDHLIPWASKYTRGHDQLRPVENFTDSWADGLAFCALLHTWFPAEVPMAGRAASTKAERVANFKLAFDVAEANGVERLLDAEDTEQCRDSKSMILYLSYLYDESKKWTVKFQSSSEWNRNYEEAEKKRKFAEWKAKQDASKPPEPIARDAPTGNVAAKWNPGSSLSDSGKESPKTPDSPLSVSKDPVGLKYAISGKGANGGPAKALLMFTCTIKKDGKALTDSKKEDLAVYIDCKSKPDKITVMGGPNGSWHVGFTPIAGGKHFIDMVFRGEFVGEPYSMVIGGADDHSYTGKEREEWKATLG